MSEQPKSSSLGIDLKGNFTALSNIAAVGAAVIRPVLLTGQGIRAYGMETVLAFCGMPVVGVAARSGAILLYWKFWCGLVLIRKCLPNRRAHTDYWGESRVLKVLTLGHNRLCEPPAAGVVAYCLWPTPLGKLIGFAAFSLAVHYWIAAAMIRRQREALHNAPIEAGWYR